MAALAHSDAALAGPELKVALADPNTRAAVADPVIKVPLAEPEMNVSPLEASDECVLSQECIDQYLWSVYERASKVDTIKVQEEIKVTVKKNGKSRTVTKTITKFVNEDFTWKDPHAAEKAGMSVAQYVIGGMDRDFKVRLYHLFRALDDAGLDPGMTSGFRDDYRQSIASGNKAATDRSYHGGKPARRLWPRACSRCRERQGRDAIGAIDLERNLVEVDRRARQGIWDRKALSR